MRYLLPMLLAMVAAPMLAADKPVKVKIPPADQVRIVGRSSSAGWSGAIPGQKVTLAPGEGLAITRYSAGPGGLEYLDRLDVLHHLDIGLCRMREKDFEALGKLANLRSLKIRGRVSGYSLGSMYGLRHLDIDGGDNLATILTQTAGLPNLTSLCIRGDDLSDANVRAALCAHKNMKILDVGVVQDVAGADLACVATLARLESLRFRVAEGGDDIVQFLESLANHRSLQKLAINVLTDHPAAYIAGIAKIEGLKELVLEFGPEAAVSDEMLAPLTGLRNLRSLTIRDASEFTGKGLSKFAEHGSLQTLKLAGKSAIGDEGAAEIARIRTLTNLCIWSSVLGDAGLKWIGGLPLTSLGLAGCREISPSGYLLLGSMRTLQRLDLSGTKLDDSGVIALADLQELTDLDLSITDISSVGAARLSTLPRLRNLACNCCPSVGDRALMGWAALPLIKLDVSETGITDKGVKALAVVQTLVELDLTQTRVTDEGIAALAGLKALSLLRVRRCYFLSNACAKELSKAAALRYVMIDDVPNLDAENFDKVLNKAGVATFSDATAVLNERIRTGNYKEPPLPPLPAPADTGT